MKHLCSILTAGTRRMLPGAQGTGGHIMEKAEG